MRKGTAKHDWTAFRIENDDLFRREDSAPLVRIAGQVGCLKY